MSTAVETVAAPAAPARTRAVPARIPFARLVGVELQKMFDTRSGFWMLASIAILSIGASAAVIIFAPDSSQTYGVFGTAVGFPMSVVLPMIAVLSVTSEWSQRGALTTFTLVPHRGRVIGAKLIGVLLVGVVSMFVALGLGAIGNIVGTAISGADTVWDVSVVAFSQIVLANVLGMLIGFMLGVLLRNSPAAIVGYFVYSLVLPVASQTLGAINEWWGDHMYWLDFNAAMTGLFEDNMDAERWTQLGVTAIPWLLLPLLVGLYLAVRREIK